MLSDRPISSPEGAGSLQSGFAGLRLDRPKNLPHFAV